MFLSIDGGALPQRATKLSAGFDVFANEEVNIIGGETKTIKLGIKLDLEFNQYGQPMIVNKCAIPEFDSITLLDEYYFELHIRSSLRAKGLTSLGTGIIDIDYQDEIKMVIHNPICRVDYSGDPYFNPETLDVTMPHLFGVGCNWDTEGYKIKRGDKIGQLILKQHEGYLLPSECTLEVERTGGFGSTSNQS